MFNIVLGCFLDVFGMLLGCVWDVFWNVVGMCLGCVLDVFVIMFGFVSLILGPYSHKFGNMFVCFLHMFRIILGR